MSKIGTRIRELIFYIYFILILILVKFFYEKLDEELLEYIKIMEIINIL